MIRRLGAVAICAAIIAAVLGGCVSTQRSQMYFAAVDVDDENPEVKYYRVTTQARASNKKLEYVAGFHDAKAVRQLYGKVSSDGGEASNSVRMVVFNPNTGMYEMANDEVFTVMFGADASAMQKQIMAFAKSDKLGKYLGGFMSSAIAGDAYSRAASMNNATAEGRSRVSAAVKETADGIADTATPAQAQMAVVGAMRAVALELARVNGVPELLVPTDMDELDAFVKSMTAAYLTKNQ